MKHSQAASIMKVVSSIGEDLNQLHELFSYFESESEKRQFRKSLGEIMAAITTDIVMPIVAKFPDLDPDR